MDNKNIKETFLLCGQHESFEDSEGPIDFTTELNIWLEKGWSLYGNPYYADSIQMHCQMLVKYK